MVYSGIYLYWDLLMTRNMIFINKSELICWDFIIKTGFRPPTMGMSPEIMIVGPWGVMEHGIHSSDFFLLGWFWASNIDGDIIDKWWLVDKTKLLRGLYYPWQIGDFMGISINMYIIYFPIGVWHFSSRCCSSTLHGQSSHLKWDQ